MGMPYLDESYGTEGLALIQLLKEYSATGIGEVEMINTLKVQAGLATPDIRDRTESVPKLSFRTVLRRRSLETLGWK